MAAVAGGARERGRGNGGVQGETRKRVSPCVEGWGLHLERTPEHVAERGVALSTAVCGS